MRRWWNRLLVRLHLVHPTWYRATYDANTGWHESFRLRKGGNPHGPSDDWAMTRRWHDDHPIDIMDQAAFHVWPTGEGWRFGPTPEDAALSVSATDDTGDSDLDIRASVQPHEWVGPIGGAATWPTALTDEEVRAASQAIAGTVTEAVGVTEPDRGRYLELPDETLMGGGLSGYPLSDQRVLPDDSRGILVTDLTGPDDGPHVPDSMPTDQIPLPQDFNYPAPAIDLDDDR